MKKIIVLSGINISVGGTLSIYRSFLEEIRDKKLYEKYKFIIMVSDKKLFKEFEEIVTIIDFPNSYKKRITRFFIEYYYFNKFSKNLKIFAWISLNDQTPKVKAQKRILYFHNPCKFYSPGIKDFILDRWFFLACLFYDFRVQKNLKENDLVCVQQNWIGKEFLGKLGKEKILLFSPRSEKEKKLEKFNKVKKTHSFTFFYPASSRVYKNYEIIFESVKRLNKKNLNFKVVITIKGNESPYTKYLYKKYKDVKNIVWLGFQNKEMMPELYQGSDCLIFPSKLETWGLPLSEAQEYDLDILAADLPYAHESVGDYPKASFFDPNSINQLYNLMEALILNKRSYSHNILYRNTENDFNEIYSFFELLNVIES